MLACVTGSCFAGQLPFQGLLQLCGGEHTEAAWQLAFQRMSSPSMTCIGVSMLVRQHLRWVSETLTGQASKHL